MFLLSNEDLRPLFLPPTGRIFSFPIVSNFFLRMLWDFGAVRRVDCVWGWAGYGWDEWMLYPNQCYSSGMSIRPPEFLFLSINEICNLRCKHCSYWHAKQPSLDVMSIKRQEELLTEFAELSPKGKVVICGGEPMLDVGLYFHVCSVARSLGLRSLSVVNGSLIVNALDAEKVVRFGPDEISISLDGPTEEIHDRMRGCKGAFIQATTALRLLAEARSKAAKAGTCERPFKIYAMGLLTKSTYLLLDSFYDLVLNQIKADKLKLNSLQPTFLYTRLHQQVDTDTFFASESQIEPDALAEVLATCNVKYGLHYNPHWVRQVVAYFRKLYGAFGLTRGWMGGFVTDEHICNSQDRNIMVDLTGKASLCFAGRFGNVQLEVPGDMRRFWEGHKGLKILMKRCNALCGISHSVRREHATCSVVLL